jgi:peptidoglycan glycosyltransferase
VLVDRRIRILAAFLVACFGLLFLQLNNLQVREAGALRHSRYEPTVTADPLTENRGEILSADGVVLAKSVRQKDGSELRVYPQGSLFADVPGYDDVVDDAETGLEAEYDSDLTPHEPTAHNLSQLLTEQSGPDAIVTTLSAALQREARAALGGLDGSIVALDPRSGAVLAMYSNPTFDPNVLAAHDAAAVHRAYDALVDPADPGASPLIDFATQRAYAPGSTFKIVTSSAIFDYDPKLASETVPILSALALPDTDLLLHNYADERCGGSLAENLAVSCDTAFGHYGLQLGASSLAEEARAFGFNAVPPLDLPPGEVAASSFPPAASFSANLPELAYSAIGQENVSETALEDALVAAAIADGGTMMTPHLLDAVVNDAGTVVARYHPSPWHHATSAATASAVRNLMLGVTELANGTGAGLFPPGLGVAAKTGTAQTGANGCLDAWFVAFAPAAGAETPQVAVAAAVPAQAAVACQDTGATAAGPIARAVLLDALKLGL